jgi:hypothetical protein
MIEKKYGKSVYTTMTTSGSVCTIPWVVILLFGFNGVPFGTYHVRLFFLHVAFSGALWALSSTLVRWWRCGMDDKMHNYFITAYVIWMGFHSITVLLDGGIRIGATIPYTIIPVVVWVILQTRHSLKQ